MPLYVVRHGETERLIEASAASVAVRHAAKAIITVRRVTKPTEATAMMLRGVQLENAGTDPDPIPPVPLPEREPVREPDPEPAEVGPNETTYEVPEA